MMPMPLELRVVIWCLIVPLAVGSLLVTTTLIRGAIREIRGQR